MTLSEGITELSVVGYVPLKDRGFALPCFASGPRPNTWYTAVCSVDGDHGGSIVGFETFESEDICELPTDLQVRASVGDRWLDVFLWDGAIFVGLAEAVWNSVSSLHDTIAEAAPLTLLDLALVADRENAWKLVDVAFEFISARFGEEKASTWRRDTLVRQQALILLRQIAVDAGMAAEEVSDLNQIEINETDAGQFSIGLPDWATSTFEKEGCIERAEAGLVELGETLQVKIDHELHQYKEIDISEEEVTEDQSVAESPSGQDEGNILIVVAGKRAKEIARHISAPEWVPDWGGGEGLTDYAVRRLGGNRIGFEDAGARPVIDIVEEESFPDLFVRYEVVVYLVDDAVLFGGKMSSVIFPLAQHRSDDGNYVVLLAPSLPVEGPSRALNLDDKLLFRRIYHFHTTVDTSIARSPFWSGNPRRSLDRRVADIVVGAAMLCLRPSPIAEELSSKDLMDQNSIFSFAVSQSLHRNSRGGSGFGEMALASESVWAEPDYTATYRRAFAHIEFRGRTLHRRSMGEVFGVAEISQRGPDFQSFAYALVERMLSGVRIATTFEVSAEVIPPDIFDYLDCPEFCLGVKLGPHCPYGLLVTAEAPSLDLLRVAGLNNWVVARYTDNETIQEILLGERNIEVPLLPRELKLPEVCRLSANRGLATRGIDPRDVVRLGREEFERWRNESGDADLVGCARRYKTSLRDEADTSSLSEQDVVLPLAEVFNEIDKGNSAAKELLSFLPDRKGRLSRGSKRPSDLRVAWSVPSRSTERYIIDDGVLPVSIGELEPDEVPAQRFFIIEGDVSVPVLFTSRIFSVWARSTLSRSTSWMSRFSVRGTFETFPIPDLFDLRRSVEGPTQLFLGQQGHVKKVLLSIQGRGGFSFIRDGDNAYINEYIDEVILDGIGLKIDSSDVEILQRLLEMNHLRAK